jgi:hypothetical protein
MTGTGGPPSQRTGSERTASGNGALEVGVVRRYDLGAVGGVALAVDDRPVAGSAPGPLDDGVLATVALPGSASGAYRMQGLAVCETTPDGLRLLAVTDSDDPTAGAQRLALSLTW